jgi:hypothetical protein
VKPKSAGADAQITIDKAWWEHLMPTPMHKLRGEVERRLRAWCKTDYGTHWLSGARETASDRRSLWRL